MSRFKKADDKLSRAASVLMRRAREESEACDDLDAFHAPSECAALVFENWDRETDRQVSACGVDPDQLHDLIVERTTELWAYLLGA